MQKEQENSQDQGEDVYQQQSLLPENIEELKQELSDSPEDLAAIQFLLQVREESN